LTPLGLTHTFSYPWEGPDGQPFSHAWIDWDGNPGVEDLQGIGVSMDGFFSMATSAGCLISTPEDLVRFSDGLYGGDLLQPASLAEMQIDYLQAPASGLAYGLGTMSLAYPSGIDNYGHNGNLIYKTVLLHFPEKNVSIVVQQNDNRTSTPNFPIIDVFTVFDALLDACENYVPVSTHDLNDDKTITVFPNPVEDKMTIQLSETTTLDFPVQAQLMNASGRMMQVFDLNETMTTIELDDLASGLYFLKVGATYKKVVLD